MMIIIFIILAVGSVGSLMLGLKMKKGVLCMISCVLFTILAIQGYRIEVPTGSIMIVIEEALVVIVSWCGAFVSGVLSLYAVVTHLKDSRAGVGV